MGLEVCNRTDRKDMWIGNFYFDAGQHSDVTLFNVNVKDAFAGSNHSFISSDLVTGKGHHGLN